MNSVDERIDFALHALGRRGSAAVVVCIGTGEGIALRTRAYTERYGWREVAIDNGTTAESPADQLESSGLDRIDVLHVETVWDDCGILRQIDLERYGPRIIRLRRSNLRGANVFLAVRFLMRRGYAVEWFHDELIALLPDETDPFEESRPTPSAAPRGDESAALYVISYNFPEQFRSWLESAEHASPDLLRGGARFLLDNSIDSETRPGYDRLCEQYGFTVLRHGNLGITGGRLFCARHFDELPDLAGLYWFEDDMLLHPPDAPMCRNGMRTHVPELSAVARSIVEREGLDFLKLSFTEFFGDHHLNWAWYHLGKDMRDAAFPDGTFRTKIEHSGVEEGISYMVGNVHFDNWPSYMTRSGNRKMFLNGDVAEATEGSYMARGFALQHGGEMRGGVLLASPVNHRRTHSYPAAERREF